MRPFIVIAVAFVTASFGTPSHAVGSSPVPYPEGYRQWTHVKSMQIHPGHSLYDAFGGVHHLYANAKAMIGYRNGRFPDGAVIVFDLREAKNADQTTTAGARKVVGVMQKHADRFPDTGGWGFEAFKGDSKVARAVGDNAKAACFDCHTAQRARDYVFSAFER